MLLPAFANGLRNPWLRLPACALVTFLWLSTSLLADLTPSASFVEQEEPRMRLLMERLDPHHPGLEAVHQAYREDDLPTALRKLLEYYRDKDPPLGVLSDPIPFDENARREAQQAVLGIFTMQGITGRPPREPGGSWDWSYRGPRRDKEWAWFFNRQFYFRHLLNRYRETGDPTYVHVINEMVIDWVRQNPYPGRYSRSHSWRVLEAGRRLLNSWVDVFYLLREDPSFHPEARLMMLASIPDNADCLRNFHARSGNHLLTEMLALTNTAIAWPEFAQSEDWLRYAIKTLQVEIFAQSYPDGAYKELANHYQRVVLDTLQRWYALVRDHHPEEVSPEIAERMEKLWNYYAMVTRPDGTGPLNNDSDLEENARLVATVTDYFDRPDWEYIVTHGTQGTRPEDPPSRFFPWSGQAIMRSGWDRDAQWAYFEMGPYGTDHQHQDRLHISLMAGGKPFLVDAGRYIYLPGPARSYFTGAASHNLLLHNGEGSLPPPKAHRSPITDGWKITPAFDYFTARAFFPEQAKRGQGRPFHQRTVYYQRDSFWIVLDETMAFGASEWEARWRFHPEVTVEKKNRHRLLAEHSGTYLHLSPLGDIPWQVVEQRGWETPLFRGWYSERMNQRAPASAFSFSAPFTSPRPMAWVLVPSSSPEDQIEASWKSGRIGEPATFHIRINDQSWEISLSSTTPPP